MSKPPAQNRAQEIKTAIENHFHLFNSRDMPLLDQLIVAFIELEASMEYPFSPQAITKLLLKPLMEDHQSVFKSLQGLTSKVKIELAIAVTNRICHIVSDPSRYDLVDELFGFYCQLIPNETDSIADLKYIIGTAKQIVIELQSPRTNWGWIKSTMKELSRHSSSSVTVSLSLDLRHAISETLRTRITWILNNTGACPTSIQIAYDLHYLATTFEEQWDTDRRILQRIDATRTKLESA